MRIPSLLGIAFLFSAAFAAEEAVFYRDFGAKGDGVTNDLPAIVEAHRYANERRLPVFADDNATYLLGAAESFAPIQTDTHWGKARFVVDDRPEELKFNLPLFRVLPSRPEYAVHDLKQLRRGQTELGVTLPCRSLLLIYDDSTRRFIRYGSDANQGTVQVDTLLADADGAIDPATPPNWDFENISQVKAFPVDDEPLTITGGIFRTLTNARTGAHRYFMRNLHITRSNTLVRGVRHEVVEPEGMDSWPYSGFFTVSNCARVTVEDCQVSGRKLYGYPVEGREKRKTTGTYDISCTNAVKLLFSDVSQINDIMSGALWGVMGTNFCKDVTLENCLLSRFDAHQGVTNAVIRGCTLGYQGISAIGFGTLLIENTVNYSHSFVYFRPDYGSSWQGDLIIRNCDFVPSTNFEVNVFYAKATPGHDFGYPCAMPRTITLEDFHVDLSNLPEGRSAAIFSDFAPGSSNVNAPHPYQAPLLLRVRNSTFGNGTMMFARHPELLNDMAVEEIP